MTASVHQFRPRKPNRRPGALPAHAPYPFTTADRMPAWLALLEEESARRGLAADATMAALSRLPWHEREGVAAVLEASGR